jgi:hypothetical protein
LAIVLGKSKGQPTLSNGPFSRVSDEYQIKRKGLQKMTKSKGLGRGGARKGAGRLPNAAKVDWDAIARVYFAGTDTADKICQTFGVSYGDLLAYAAANHWVPPRAGGRRNPEDLGDMASALAWALIDERDESIANRTRRFVGAMVKLEVRVSEIADVLHVSEDSLRAEFPKELAGAR